MAERTRLNFTGAQIDSILQDIDSHVSYAVEQEFDNTQKAQARSNIGASAEMNAVLTDEQELTSAQKIQARANIGATSPDAIEDVEELNTEVQESLDGKVDFSKAQSLSEQSKKLVQSNMGLDIVEKNEHMIIPVGLDSAGKLWTYDISKPLDPTDWDDVGKIIQRGLAPTFWSVGDQLNVKKTVNGVTETLVFDILGFDYDTPVDENVSHTMSLVLHNVYSYSEIPFDRAEALFYFSNGLPAGDYTYTYNGTAYQFTLSTAWPTNTQVTGSTGTLTPYQKGALTSTGVTATASAGSTGTNLGTATNNLGSSTTLTIDGVSYPVEMNACYRVSYGSNRWETSSDRQYLNGETAGAASGAIASWWTPQTGFDRPTTSTKPGFLYGIEDGFKDLLVTVKKRTRLFNAGDVTGTYKDSDEKVFFLSQTEVNLSKESNVYENSFGTDRTFTNILTTPYPLYVGAGNADRIKYQGTTARYWWLRGPYPSYAHIVRYVHTDGSLYYYDANNSRGIVPALCAGR